MFGSKFYFSVDLLQELGIGEHFSLYEYSEFYTEKKFRKLDKLRNWKLEEKLDSTAVESSKDQQSCSYWHNEVVFYLMFAYIDKFFF